MVKRVRNGEVDILRFIFAIFIFLHHFGFCAYAEKVCRNGWLGVEFFFLLTGYFMAYSAKKILGNDFSSDKIANQTWKFIINKVKSFYPYYFAALFIKVIFVAFTRPFDKMLELLFKSIPTFILLLYPLNWNAKGIYITDTWFLSAMITSIFVLFPLLLYRFDLMSKIVFPITSFFTLGFLLHEFKTLNVHGQWSNFAYTGTIRATAEIMAGAGLFQAVSFVNKIKFSKPKIENFEKLFFTVVKYAIFAAIFLYIVWGGVKRKLDLHIFLFCAVALVLSLSKLTFSLRQSKLSDIFGKSSLIIYIFHGLILDITAYFIPKGTQILTKQFVILCIFVILTCFLLSAITNAFFHLLKKLKE